MGGSVYTTQEQERKCNEQAHKLRIILSIEETAIEGVKRRKRLPNKTLMITLLDAEQTKTMKAILPPLGIDSKFMEVE